MLKTLGQKIVTTLYWLIYALLVIVATVFASDGIRKAIHKQQENKSKNLW